MAAPVSVIEVIKLLRDIGETQNAKAASEKLLPVFILNMPFVRQFRCIPTIVGFLEVFDEIDSSRVAGSCTNAMTMSNDVGKRLTLVGGLWYTQVTRIVSLVLFHMPLPSIAGFYNWPSFAGSTPVGMSPWNRQIRGAIIVERLGSSRSQRDACARDLK